MSYYYQLSIITEIGIPLKKLENLSEKRQLNLFKRELQEYMNNLIIFHGCTVITTIDNNNTLGNVVFTEDSYSYIHDFNYSAYNILPLNKEYKVLRYFGSDLIIRSETKLTDNIFTESKITKIKRKNLINIKVCSYKELNRGGLGYCYLNKSY